MNNVKRFSRPIILAIATLLILTTGTLAGHPTDEPTLSLVQTTDSAWAVPSGDESSSGGDARATYIPGETYWGRKHYIEYIAGNLPIIISAPHGGYLKPSEIPDRTWGSMGHDYRSQEYTREVANYITEITGRYPHVIINHLHRSKLDANRDLNEAAQGNQWAEQAWYEFHAFIDDAEAASVMQCDQGHYFDFHSNGHADQWVELGFALTSSNLNRSDEALNSSYYKNKSSLRNIANTPGIYFPEIVRGATSLGGLLQAWGYKSVPSPAHPHPGGSDYFSGGYNSRRHGSKNGGTIDGTQVETYYGFLHDNIRDVYAYALAESIVDFLETHYGFNLREGPVCPRFYIYLPAIVRDS